MENIFEDSVLSDLFAIRRDGFEKLVTKNYGACEELKKVDKTNQELQKLVKETIEDKEKQIEILNQLYGFHDAMFGEMEYWSEHYYKFGLVDGLFLKEEIKGIIEKIKK